MPKQLRHNDTIMNRLNKDQRTQIITALVEGNSIRATARMCNVAFNTVLKLVPEIGKVCAEYQDRVLRDLPCKLIQCDEIWSFVYAKKKNVPADKEGQFGYGDVWTWTALDAETKLVPSWNRVQLTTDGHRVYLSAVESAFGADIDYAMLVKVYEGDSSSETRYSPAECVDCQMVAVTGRPDPKHISTSYVERQNLTMRMNMRRFTRLTNAFSKKVENHAAAIALHYMYYNFCRIHKTLRVTPAMAAGVSDHVWDISEIAGLLESK